MPLHWLHKQLWGRNTDKRGVEGNPNPGCTKKAAAGVAGEEKNRKTLKGRSSADWNAKGWLASQVPHYGTGDPGTGNNDSGLANSICWTRGAPASSTKTGTRETQHRKGHDLNDCKSHLMYGVWEKLQVGFFEDYRISSATPHLGHQSKSPSASQSNVSQHPQDEMGQHSLRDAPKVIHPDCSKSRLATL